MRCTAPALCRAPTGAAAPAAARSAAVLPLVCRGFYWVLADANAVLWRDLAFEANISQPGQLARARCFARWLRRCGGLAHSLQLDLWSGGLPHFSRDVIDLQDRLEATLAGWRRLPAAARRLLRGLPPPMSMPATVSPAPCPLPPPAAAVLPSCSFLRMRWGGPSLEVGEWVSKATSLTCLALRWEEGATPCRPRPWRPLHRLGPEPRAAAAAAALALPAPAGLRAATHPPTPPLRRCAARTRCE